MQPDLPRFPGREWWNSKSDTLTILTMHMFGYIRIPYFEGYLRLATQLCLAFLHRVHATRSHPAATVLGSRTFGYFWAQQRPAGDGSWRISITGVPPKQKQHFRSPRAALSDSWQRSAHALECGIFHGFSQVVLITFDHSILITSYSLDMYT